MTIQIDQDLAAEISYQIDLRLYRSNQQLYQ